MKPATTPKTSQKYQPTTEKKSLTKSPTKSPPKSKNPKIPPSKRTKSNKWFQGRKKPDT